MKKRLSQKERYAGMLERQAASFENTIVMARYGGIISSVKANLDMQWVKAYRAAARAIRDGGF